MYKFQLYKNTGRGIYIGAIDAITKAYIRKNEVFADAFNYFMYDGAQVIQPECLKELDPTEIAILLNEKETMEISDPIVRRYAQDYQIHLINPNQIEDEELEKFQSSLREVMGCIKYSKSKEKLAAFINNNPRMNMEAAAARVIEAINHVPIRIQEGDGKFNMCEAIEEMIKDGREAGREVGRQEGQNRINQLNILLSKENRGEDIIKAAEDREYQEQLFKEFNL